MAVLQTENMAYVARRPDCGCTVLATMRGVDAAREIAQCMREGMIIDRVPGEWVRTEAVWGCATCQPEKYGPRQEGLGL